MVKTNVNLSTFDEVANAYIGTKPLRGKHAQHDVRPIADRRRKHERIKKLDSNCYLLMDGDGFGDDISWWGTTRTRPTIAEMKALAAIRWDRRPDGDFVTIRNGSGKNWSHQGRYDFLARNMPWGMTFVSSGGKQFIRTIHGQYYLPKSSYYPVSVNERYSPPSLCPAGFTTTDDEVSLTFNARRMVLEHKPHPIPVVRVDKAMKEQYKPHLETLYKRACIMTPMLPLYDYNWQERMREESILIFKGLGWHDPASRIDYIWETLPIKYYREIVSDPEHPAYYNLSIAFAICTKSESGWRDTLAEFLIQTANDKESVAKLRSNFNRWANNVFGLTTIVMKEHTNA